MGSKKTAFIVFIIAFSLGLNVMGVSPILGALNHNFASLPVSAVQLLQTIPYALLMAAALFIGRLTLMISKKRLVLAGLLLIGICGTLPFFNNNYRFLLLTRILIGLGFGLVGTLNTAIISDFIKAENRPAYMGLHVAGMGIGALIGNLQGGIIAAIHYRYFFLVYTAAFISAVGVTLFLLETPPQKNVEHSSLKMSGKVYFISFMSFAHTLFITAFSTNIGMFILETMKGNTALAGTVIAVNAAFALLVGFTFSFITKIFGKWTLAAAFLFGTLGFIFLLWIPGIAGIFSGGALCGVSLSCFMARGTYLISTAVKPELQMLIQYIGPHTGRLKMRIKGFRPDDRNPLFLHDMNRCVLCGRCVRACNELRGVDVLQYQKKGMETFVGALQNKLLVDAGCRFCGACAEVCPTGTIRDKKELTAGGVKKEDGAVPCRFACPAHTDIPRYIRYVNAGKFDEAAAVIREKLPFPKTLGRVCTHTCELECRRKEINEAMSIRNIKRYAVENDTCALWKGKGKQLPDTGKKVCVVGGGPAGLTAAYYLRKQGHSVTVKEALPSVGGMLSYGIPSYRLPRNIVEEETALIAASGVKIETGVKVEKPLELLPEFDAVLMAIGGHAGVRLPMEGNSLPGVLLNTDFLRAASMEKEAGNYTQFPEIGKKAIILGGGNVAFDCARTAIRLGAEEVHVACLEAEDQMPADTEEIEQAMEEGIRIHPGKTFERITGSAKATGVDFMAVERFSLDENQRAVIEKRPGSEEHIAADTVIFAVGQRPDITGEEQYNNNLTK
ncbi:MAG: MFS transporter [Treponema sp.]|jgi:NADPH-dependent glutamate synthase beta subunit-like oxidoreductase/MFS family permease|nr:MFS transporter [Treponema sp.]